MKNKLKSISNIPFLACLAILLLNDFYFKAEYHNWLTGKLSDFCGLFVFVTFWTAIISNRKRTIYITTAILFVVWKSPYSQLVIDLFSQNLYPIHRVVDMTDLIALSVLPIAFYFNPDRYIRLKLNSIPLAFLSVFSFCATSIPEPTLKFEQPQYLLFKSGIINFESSEYPSEYEVYNLDSLLIVNLKEIRIDKRAPMDDEFHKVQILKDIDLRFLRELKDGYRTQNKLTDYEELKDSLVVGERTTITLKLDSITDHLEFNRTRLNGDFNRFSNENKLIINGKFRNGIEDSVWTFYNNESEIISKKHFESGELTRTELFDNSNLKSEIKFNTRNETIRNKYFHLAIVFLLILGLLIKLYLNYKSSDQKDIIQLSNFSKIAGSLALPLGTLIIAKLFSSLIPNSYSTFFLGIFGEGVLIYIITTPLFLLIFYYLRLRSKFDLIYYILLLSLAVVLTEEWIYLRNII